MKFSTNGKSSKHPVDNASVKLPIIVADFVNTDSHEHKDSIFREIRNNVTTK